MNVTSRQNQPVGALRPFTKREQETWDLHKQGLSIQEIAQRMKIKPSTVLLKIAECEKALGWRKRTYGPKVYLSREAELEALIKEQARDMHNYHIWQMVSLDEGWDDDSRDRKRIQV